MRVLRLTFRINRFEVLSVGALGTLTVLGGMFVIWRIAGLGISPACFQAIEAGVFSGGCEDQFRAFQDVVGRFGQLVIVLGAFFPVVGGLLVGGPAIAREIERGTARLAWSMSPSRWRWYAHRVLPMLAFLLVVAFAVGVTLDRLMGATNPTEDLANSFTDFRMRGVLVATEAAVVAATGLAVGAVLGRSVPTFLLSLILGGLVIYGGVANLHRSVLLGEAELQVCCETFTPGELYLDSRFQLPDGRLVGYEELPALGPEISRLAFEGQLPQVTLVIPGSRYREVETREAAAHAGIVAALLVVAAVVVDRRRPA
jgi:hypothetical protein